MLALGSCADASVLQNRSLLMVTGRNVAGIMRGGGLGSGEAGRDGGAAVIRAAEQLDWNAWSQLEGGVQAAQGARFDPDPIPYLYI